MRIKTADPRRVVGFVRVSKDEQHLSPEAQRDALLRWCELNGATLVDIYEEIGVSGGTKLEKRLGVLQAIDALARHNAGILLVAKRDRLSRDPMITAMIEAGAKMYGARVVSAAGEGAEDDPTGILMRRIVDAFAEYERLVIKARVCAALQVKRKRGERTGGVPIGFRVGADGKTLEPESAEQETLAIVRGLRQEGLSVRAIATRLNELG